MMTVISLALKSLRNRKVTIGLTIISIGLSVALFLGVERIRLEVQNGFTNTISGTDLIVGARTSQVQLLLASVFRLGNMPNNISYHSFKEIASLPQVKWAVPISLGDSHAGYRVIGTNGDYFTHLQFGSRQHLGLMAGEWISDSKGAVLGAKVAENLGYTIGSQLVISHGGGKISFLHHEHHPFTVTGILKPTGTPIDRTVHVNLGGIAAIHDETSLETGHNLDLLADSVARHMEPDQSVKEPDITAIFLGLQSRSEVLSVQRVVNDFHDDPLTAVIPAAALQELWQIVSGVEKSLLAVSGFVVVVGLSGMMVAIMTSLNERRREMAILRAMGATPGHIFGLVVGEASVVTLAGVTLGVALLYGMLIFLQPLINSYFGLFVTINIPSLNEVIVILMMCLAGAMAGVIPGYRIYRYSLADGMTIRL